MLPLTETTYDMPTLYDVPGFLDESSKPTYLAIGVRVKKYKQRPTKRCGMKDYNQEKLCECPSDLK